VNRALSLAALCGLLVVVPAWAQGPAPAPSPAAKAEALSDAEKTRRASEAITSMRNSLRQVSARVEDARNEKDVVKLNCVNEKLAQVKGLLKVAEQAEVSLRDAISNKDPSASTEFAKIGIARSKVDGLSGDAQQCIGQLAYIVDEKTTVEVQQPAGQPDRDTSGQVKSRPPPAMPVVLRPPPASSFN
jgi:hypothetical protein